MGAVSEYELISRAAEFALAHAETVEGEIEDWLQTHADTPSVNALRMLTMFRAIVAIGSFSVFEDVLQTAKGWEQPFGELDSRLRTLGYVTLADRFTDYRNAINVLKHGRGRSYEALVSRRHRLEFAVKPPDQVYFHEGDVAEGLHLIRADDKFVRGCSDIIREVISALRRQG